MANFMFNGFTLRSADPLRHAVMARDWTLADPYHRDSTGYAFWFEKGAGVECYLLEDRLGALFFFKMARVCYAVKPDSHGGKLVANPDAAELHIQFSPPLAGRAEEAVRRARVMRGLRLGLLWIERALVSRRVTEVFFTSKNPALVRFAVKRLGFTAAGQQNGCGERLVKKIGN
jgi:hypothetical protein